MRHIIMDIYVLDLMPSRYIVLCSSNLIISTCFLARKKFRIVVAIDGRKHADNNASMRLEYWVKLSTSTATEEGIMWPQCPCDTYMYTLTTKLPSLHFHYHLVKELVT